MKCIFACPSLSPQPCCPSPHPNTVHPLGADLLASEAFTRQTQGMSREGRLGSGAREQPSWLELGPREGAVDIWPVCLSHEFGHEVWTLSTWRTSGHSMNTLSFSRPFAHPHPLRKPSVPSRTLAASQPESSWVGVPAGDPGNRTLGQRSFFLRCSPEGHLARAALPLFPSFKFSNQEKHDST